MHSAKITIISDQEMCLNGDDLNIHYLKSIIVYGDKITDYCLKSSEQIKKEEDEFLDSFDDLEPIDEIVIRDKVSDKSADISVIQENVEMAVNEMSEYMTMKEAFDKCGDDDIPYIAGAFNDNIRRTKKHLLSIQDQPALIDYMLDAGLSDKWQVQKKEEFKILTDGEIANNVACYLDFNEKLSWKHVKKAIELSGKNGQRKEWQMPEQIALREAVKIVLDLNERCGLIKEPNMINNLNNAYKNLKPPPSNERMDRKA